MHHLPLNCFTSRARLALAACVLAPAAWSQNPNLRVTSIDTSVVVGNWQALSIGGSLQVNVENSGLQPAAQSFDVLAFDDVDFDGLYSVGIDNVLGVASVAGLGAGAQLGVSIPLSGSVRFRDDVLHVFVDSSDAVLEDDEADNLSDSGLDCASSAPPGAITPTLQWSWTSSAVEPASLSVMMTPVVMDMNADAVPDIVFGSTDSTGGALVEVGILRALDGATGAELWTVTDPSLSLNVAFNIAAADIDGDGLPEIVAADANNTQLVCFENDGSFKWRSAVLEAQDWGSAAIADLDGDGQVEIVTGRQVLDSAGNLLWTGLGGAGTIGSGALSMVCDFDLDGVQDIVAGNTVYNANGAVLCDAPLLPDGYNAVANFDGDAEPELVLVSNGALWLLERDALTPTQLSIVWGPVLLVGGGGGAPTVADYDGDGLPEIGVAGAAAFEVYEHDGTLRWQSVTQDSTSYRTGSSVFDFNGDGAAEAIYRDELKLRIYDGSSGAVLFETPMSSCTWHEYVLVADVDADGNAEIVAVANDNCGFGTQRGVYVFSDLNDDWVPTRRVWNQYSYHITNIDESGAVPAFENPSWLFPAGAPFNSYRQNQLSTTQLAAAPDLTASLLQLTPVGAPDTLVARIGNGGSFFVPAGVAVSFYDGDPNAGGMLLGTVATSAPLAPRNYEDVALFLGYAPSNVWVVADDAGLLVGAIDECDELNNTFGIAVDPVTYCTGKLNSAGCVPTISTSGLPSASATSGFVVQCNAVGNNKFGLLFYRAPGVRSAAPFLCGTLCVATPVQRTSIQPSGGNVGPNDCSGVWSLDMNCFASGGCGPAVPAPALLVPGTQVNCQFWGRDAGAPPCNAQLSDAVEYFVLP
jgi:hypothetical protein